MNQLFYFICILFTLSNLHAYSYSTDDQNRKKALIFGVTGQDGIYLSEFLLSKNYVVHGVARKFYSLNTDQIKQISSHPQFCFHAGDITNQSKLIDLIENIQPDEIYNLAAQTHVQISFESPEETADINALGTLRILHAIKLLGLEKKIKLFQASSSELFGFSQECPQTEKTPFYPHSPYAVSKLFGYWITINYRESFHMFACNGILFNHESPLRGEMFVTRKISLAACRYKLGLQDVLYLGNLDTMRDWGYAKDYIEAMWQMLQQDEPDDYIIATGEAHSVREFVELAFKQLDVEIEWHGQGLEEYGIDKLTGKTIVKIDPKYYRPNEVNILLGKSEKAENVLKWKPKISFKELVKIMIEADYQKVQDEKAVNLVNSSS